MIKKIFNWIFSKELKEIEVLKEEYVSNIYEIRSLNNKIEHRIEEVRRLYSVLDVAVDINPTDRSWAVISLQGQNKHYVKFVDLGDDNLIEISKFLRNFEDKRINIDSNPIDFNFLHKIIRENKK